MLKRARALWAQVRRSICPQRIYQYGTVSLCYFDDRTPLERLCDSVDAWFWRMEQEARHERAKRSRFWSLNWKDGLGNTAEHIREKERKGYAYASEREWDQVVNAARRDREEKENREIQQKVEFAVSEIKKGRKYSREWQKKIAELKSR